MENKKECLVCKKSSKETPVTKFYYQETSFYICPQHIPVLIHDPKKLVGLLYWSRYYAGRVIWFQVPSFRFQVSK